ncbi:nucleoside hydrolase [Aeromonas jandaei]
MIKKPVILDCDPGHDDAIMMMIALSSKEIDVLGITTSAGNQTQEKTNNNAGRLLTLFNKTHIPLVKGAHFPLIRPLRIAADVHGETGIDGAILPNNKANCIEGVSAPQFIHNTISKSDIPVYLVATGPLTNIANFLREYPEDKDKIASISIMGGACFGGNITPVSEFNIHVDPEAAEIVFNSGIHIIMSGLDVTLKAQLMNDDIKALKTTSHVGEVMGNIVDFYHKTTTRNFLAEDNAEEGAHMHDPCAIAYLIRPEIFIGRDMNVSINTQNGLGLGQTICDYNHITGKSVNATVLFGLNRQKFADLVLESARSY